MKKLITREELVKLRENQMSRNPPPPKKKPKERKTSYLK